MTRIAKAFKFQIDNKFNLFKTQNVKKLLITLFKHVLLFGALLLGLNYLLSKIFFMLGLKVNAEFLCLILIGCQAVLFCFDIANIITTLYLSKDNELLLVLPLTFNEIFISKILVLYVSDLIFSLTYLFPIFIVLGMLGDLSATYFIMSALFLFVLPIFPIALASIVSIPAMFVVRFLKKHPLVSVLTILVAVGTVFVLYMSLITNVSGAFNIAEQQISSSIRINQAIKEIGSSIFGYFGISQSFFDFGLFYRPLLFLIVSLVLFLGCFLLIRPFYFRIATLSTENSTPIRKKEKAFRAQKPFTSLLLNEIRSVFRSPDYVFQYFLFPLFMPLIVYTYDKLLISIAVNQAGKNMIIGSHVLVLSIISLMSNTISSTAISREGGTFYIAKSSPVSFYTQVKAKISFNAIFTFASILITTATTLLFTKLDAFVVLMSGLSMLLLSFGHICHSFDMDLRSPVLDWYDNSEITTIGKNTTKCIIAALLLSLVACLIVIFGASINVYAAFLFLLLYSGLYCLARTHLLYVRTKYYYEKMEI